MMGRVGYAVVYAQAKQLLKEWTSDDVKKALEPESLSLERSQYKSCGEQASLWQRRSLISERAFSLRHHAGSGFVTDLAGA